VTTYVEVQHKPGMWVRGRVDRQCATRASGTSRVLLRRRIAVLPSHSGRRLPINFGLIGGPASVSASARDLRQAARRQQSMSEPTTATTDAGGSPTQAVAAGAEESPSPVLLALMTGSGNERTDETAFRLCKRRVEFWWWGDVPAGDVVLVPGSGRAVRSRSCGRGPCHDSPARE
jgi:hypothetical protein